VNDAAIEPELASATMKYGKMMNENGGPGIHRANSAFIDVFWSLPGRK